MHQQWSLDIMQAAAVSAEGIVLLRPSAMHIVQFHLKGAVFMSGVAEGQSAVSAEHAGIGDGRHILHRRTEDHRTGRYTSVHAEVELRCTQTGLSLYYY